MFKPGMRRAIASLVLVTFSALVLQPLSAAAQTRAQPAAADKRSESGDERFSRLLNEVHEVLKETVPHAALLQTARPTGGKPGEMDVRAIGPQLKLEVERAKPLVGVDSGKKVGELRA